MEHSVVISSWLVYEKRKMIFGVVFHGLAA